MDQLAAIILHGHKVTNKELLGNLLSRAEENRVPELYLKTVSKFCNDPFIISKLEIWETKKRAYDLGFQKIMQRLIDNGIQFMLVKHAQYLRASYDADILFKNIEEYERAMPILRETVRLGLIRPDPHVGGLRDMRGCRIVIPTRDLWSRRQKKRFFDMEINVPSVEDQIILFHLHMLKHREIFLGDVVSILHLYNTEHNSLLLSHLVNKYSLISIFHFASNLFHYLSLKETEAQMRMPVLSQFIEYLARKKSQELFPILLPKVILALSVLHFHERKEFADSQFHQEC
jgi:hypothetical protein